MKVSVIIPTYKPKDYIWECLGSLVCQTLAKDEYEVVLVLNGCTDPWKREIENYIDKTMRGMNVRFIHTEQGGVSNARNIALDLAEGAYITFIDDDDYVSPSYLQELLDVASRDTIALCYPLSFKDGSKNYKPFYITKDYNPSYIAQLLPWKKARRFFNGPVYKLIHRDIIGDRRFDIRFTHGEDSLYMFSISDRFKFVSFTSENAVYYRRNRVDSAVRRQRSLAQKITNEWRLFIARTLIFLSCPLRYSIKYYLRSIVSSIAKLMS